MSNLQLVLDLDLSYKSADVSYHARLIVDRLFVLCDHKLASIQDLICDYGYFKKAAKTGQFTAYWHGFKSGATFMDSAGLGTFNFKIVYTNNRLQIYKYGAEHFRFHIKTMNWAITKFWDKVNDQ